MKNLEKEFGFKFTDFNVSDIGKDVKADLFYKNDTYTIALYDNKRLITKSWSRIGYEPRFGVDVADFGEANEVIEEMIKEWQNNN